MGHIRPELCGEKIRPSPWNDLDFKFWYNMCKFSISFL